MRQHPMRKPLSSWVRKWFTPRRSQPIRRKPHLELEPLEPREMPAANPVLALGAETGRLPLVRVLDQQGTLIRSFAAYDASVTGGVRTAVADLNRDGVNDIVTAPGPGAAPLVKVWDGASGSLLNQFWAYDPAFRGGVQVAAGDIGRGEVGVVTGPDQGSSQVRVFNSQGVLRTGWDVFGPSSTSGVRVALGYAANGNAAVFAAAGPGSTPQVQSIEIRTGQTLASFTAYAPTMTGGVWIAAADLTGDGVSEIVTGAGPGYAPQVKVFSSTGRPLTEFLATSASDRNGVMVGVVTGREGQPQIATLVGSSRSKQVRLFDPRSSGTPTPLASYRATGAGSLATPSDRSEVKRFDASNPTPRTLRQSYRHRAIEVTAAGYSAFPVRYGDGVVHFQESDLAADGFGTSWGVTRSWTNEGAYSQGQNVGRGWIIAETPSLIREVDPFWGAVVLTVVTGGTAQQVFDEQPGGSYVGRGGILDTLVYESASGQYRLTAADGTTLWFWDFDAAKPAQQQGQFAKLEDPKGNVTEVTALLADGRIGEVQRSAPASGSTVTESYLFTYVTGGVNAGLIASITQRRRVGSGPWNTVRKAEYVYYDGVEAHGSAGDLKKVVVKDAAGAVLETSYYRYYVAGEASGYEGGLKFVFRPQAYARLAANVANPETATDGQIAPYADHYFEYDDQFRVTQEIAARAGDDANGGRGTFSFSYTTNELALGGDPNAWLIKTVETLPDGNQNIVYTNANRQVMLKVFQDTATSQQWRSFYQYDAGGRLILAANPSAVTGYDETSPDLLVNQWGNYQYLSDTTGLITVWTYGTLTTATETTPGDATGRLKQVAVQRGEFGTAVPQQDVTYIQRTAGGSGLFFVANVTAYRNDDGTGAITTSYAYTWQGTTAQPESVTVTLPVVSTEQNGPGTATTVTTVFDAYGRPIWRKDGGGFLTYIEYDPATGAVVKEIRDVDTTQTSTFSHLPSGWTTPAGGGLHLTTTYEVDALGRVTKQVHPNGRVDYFTYNDVTREVRTYAGWDTSTNAPTLPTQVVRADWANGYVETLTMSAMPTVADGRPTGTEPISDLQTLSRVYTNASGQVTQEDAYFNLAGLSYSTSTNLGTANTHFYRTEFGYDAAGRLDRTLSPTGTIYRTVWDSLGRAVSQWVGLDDTPTSGGWSPTNTAGTDLVKVGENEYDNGGTGDGNLTKVTQFAGGGAAPRVTQTWYDWRNRPVAVKSGAETSESDTVNRPLSYVEYDNLGQVTVAEVYDGDGVSVVDGDGDGVPDRPAASLLRAKSVTSYDDLGRVYRTAVYSVDPLTGAVSTHALTSNTWYDARGQVVKVASPGGLVEKYRYDGVGRLTQVFTSDGGGDTSYADAFDVGGDIVLSQAEYAYDANDNLLQTTVRQRFHDASGTGELGTPTSGIGARVSYAGFYYDLADRLIATVDVGTNGGTAWTRPGTVPTRSDTVLVTSQTYNAAGWVESTTDPKGIVSKTYYDNLGRTTKTIANYVDGFVGDDNDITTEFTYNAVGLTSLTSRRPDGSGQTTQWVYGVSLATGSGLNSNDLVGQTRWPDPTMGNASSAEQETVTVNALGQTLTTTDRNGTVHTLSYDVLGRVISDVVTTLGAGVDGSVRRIETAYDSQGNAYLITSHDAPTGGNIVNQVKREFNGLGQLTSEWQEHAGAVTGSSPWVQYSYSEMTAGANHSRLVSITYPNGKVLNYNYAAGLDDAISRLSSLSENTGILESYDYLGESVVVARKHPQPGVDLSYIKRSGEANGDAGDPYTGLDRFGRIVDQRWLTSSDGSALDRLQYTYDRNGNRLSRTNLIDAAFSESYSYDHLNQLIGFTRGSHSRSWDYDAQGNWESVTTNGSTQTRTHNAQNEITGISGATTPTYDANGNLTRDDAGRQFVYDAWNRLVAVKDAGGNTLKSYAYDGLHRRISETAGGVTTDLYYSDSWQVLEERVGGQVKAQYVWSPVYVDALVLRDRDSNGDGTLDERLYVVQDANYNVTALFDNSGNVVERYVYDPFGQVTILDAGWNVLAGSSFAWLYLHQGGRFDATSGLYHFRFRDYSPTLGRWTSLDPIRYDAGDVNLYRVLGNGLPNRLDPLGLFDLWDWLANDVIGTDNVRSWDSVLGHHRTGWFAQLSNGAAGMGDTVSMGLTGRVRQGLGYDDVVDYHSGAYAVGEVAGTGVNLGLAFVNPCAVGGSIGTGVRVINGIQAFGGSLNAGDNLAAGNYGAAALDLIGVAGNSFQMLRPCFPGEVQVLTRRGWVRWDALTTSDEVLSLPEDQPEGELAYRPVEEVFRRWGVIWEVTVAGRVLRTTAEHPFWVRGKGWTAAKELRAGDALRSHDGQWLAVEGVRDTGPEEAVYNCRVAEYHTYFVGDEGWGWSVWAHNSYNPPSTAVRAGEAGSYSSLHARRVTGDGLTPHHMPQAALGFTNYGEGGALMLPHAEHVLTRTYGVRGARLAVQEAGVPFRTVLARDIQDVRRIAGSRYNQGLLDLIQYYRTNFPHLMTK